MRYYRSKKGGKEDNAFKKEEISNEAHEKQLEDDNDDEMEKLKRAPKKKFQMREFPEDYKTQSVP